MIAKYYEDSEELLIAVTMESEIKERKVVGTRKEAEKICKERKIKLMK